MRGNIRPHTFQLKVSFSKQNPLKRTIYVYNTYTTRLRMSKKVDKSIEKQDKYTKSLCTFLKDDL